MHSTWFDSTGSLLASPSKCGPGRPQTPPWRPPATTGYTRTSAPKQHIGFCTETPEDHAENHGGALPCHPEQSQTSMGGSRTSQLNSGSTAPGPVGWLLGGGYAQAHWVAVRGWGRRNEPAVADRLLRRQREGSGVRRARLGLLGDEGAQAHCRGRRACRASSCSGVESGLASAGR